MLQKHTFLTNQIAKFASDMVQWKNVARGETFQKLTLNAFIAPTAPPSDVVASPQDGGGITVSWGDVDVFEANGIVRSFVIVYYKLATPEKKHNVTVE